MQDFQTKILICRDCHEEFVYTADAQVYFEARGLVRGPDRCKACHILSKKQSRLDQQASTATDLGLCAG